MSEINWNVTFKLYRQKGEEPPHFDTFTLEVDPEEYVLDAIERVWAFHDRSLCFRHACHHSTCGACGMRVNNVEKLTCITPIRDVTQNGGTVKVEPLRNFPVLSDLAVDMGSFYTKMELVGAPAVLPVTEAEIENPPGIWNTADSQYIRLSDCIECGLCISACPVGLTSASYLGPAVLAGAHMHGLKGDAEVFSLVNSDVGVWRCHSAFECTEVCPSFVDPAKRIMELRKQVVIEYFRRVFRRSQPKEAAVEEAQK